MKYKYSSVYNPNPYKKFTKRPMVEIEVFNGKESIKGLGLIDSGADKSLFNIEYAKEIGINLSQTVKENFLGISGEAIPCYIAEIEIRIQKLDKKVKIEAGFIASPSVGILLGQEGFFDKHRIKFEKDHDTFEITPVKKK